MSLEHVGGNVFGLIVSRRTPENTSANRSVQSGAYFFVWEIVCRVVCCWLALPALSSLLCSLLSKPKQMVVCLQEPSMKTTILLSKYSDFLTANLVLKYLLYFVISFLEIACFRILFLFST